ncbi:DUF2793 domain-containing protein [Lentibacter algarum]|uniref:DUF2793 domain-containing protein n=1 Tax=Lentibacter algarum TaxID=576131 RepID=UPI001C067F82|nr:DUF2793 domain-containing protein [Lentibacter algarum]MBU2980671.1 DUF2793 domain-containing protein [Lentibacter algarum]
MPERSPRHKLPYIQPSQAQKHVTHNEAVERLDAAVQASVIGIDQDSPPAAPQEGDQYGIGAAPTGDWASHAGELAQFSNGSWLFLEPQEGWRLWDKSENKLKAQVAGVWTDVAGTYADLDGIGIGSVWDATNRLSVVSPGSLFSHEGNDHRMIINKAGVSDTASLLMQTNWTGHAELGLSGDNALSFKVSADGSTWYDALKADATAQEVTVDMMLTGDAVQQTPTDTTTGRLMRADYGYSAGNVLGTVSETAGVPTGAIVEQGSNVNGEYIRWADGTQICTHNVLIDQVSCTTGSGALFRSGLLGAFNFPASFTEVHFASASMAGSDVAQLRNNALQARLGFFQDSTPNYWHGLVQFTTASVSAGSGEYTNYTLFAIGRWF